MTDKHIPFLVLLTMSHTPDNQDRQSKSPVPPQGSDSDEGMTDVNHNSASHNLIPKHDTNTINAHTDSNGLAVSDVSDRQPNIITVGPPHQAEGRESKRHPNHENEKNGGGAQNELLSVAGTSPQNFSAQGKHQFEASQAQGFLQHLQFYLSNNQPQSDQAGSYERGDQLHYEYPRGTSLPPNRDNPLFLENRHQGLDPGLFQNHNSSRSSNNMSLSYESRSFMSDTQYPMQMAHEAQEQDEFKPHDEPHYPSPPPPMSENPYTAQTLTATPEHQVLELPEPPKDEEGASSPGRSKPIPKPDREITKDANGRFYCTWPGCTEEIKDFNRKCEWR